MKKKVIALALCLVMLLTGLGMSEVAFDLFANPLSISCDGNTVDSVTLPQNEKRLLTALKDEEVLSDCQWQIQASEDVWVDIAGANTPTLELSYAMVANLLNNDAVNLRFRTSADDGDAFSDAVKVMVEREAAVGIKMMMSAANEAAVADDEPKIANYTVRHYQQNVENDEYTLVDTETKSGTIGTEVSSELEKPDAGFYALPYNEKATINADHSTVVEIKYDRYYYLMSFNLDGGYGVEPVYAKFGANIGEIENPQKAGYTFAGWQLNGEEVKNLPQKMPAEKQTYTAKWYEANTHFTVAYWLQNADDDYYSVFATKTVDIKSGSVVNGNTYKDEYPETSENLTDVLRHITFNDARTDKNVTIAGDGSTVVNVYYDREEYTLKFYYAMSSGSDDKTEYYVVGGSTYAFGSEAAISANGDALKLIDQYMGTNISARGTVNAMPALNEKGKEREYDSYFDESTVSGTKYNYHYISFKAKYGADISELWPCDVFNSVTRTSGGDNGGIHDGKNYGPEWKEKDAFVSAWNGEHHVKYSQINYKKNQTIKGKYSQLDEQLLWDKSKFNSYADENNTVDFLCFWENGANVYWSVPELYRYNIYVPVLDGQDTNGLTIEKKDGIDYYLRDQYDTVDDSDVNGQTQPSIKGFSANGRDSSGIEDYEKTLYVEAHNVNFYYTRNQYKLTFMNYDGNIYESQDVYFEDDISSYECCVPSYPDSLEKDAYKFEGWYTSSVFAAETEFDFKDKQMPANDMVLYAHWVPVTHTVKFYWDKGELESDNPCRDPRDAPHNTTIDVEDLSAVGYEFVGWFYMDGDTEKAFDFVNMPVVKNMSVYGKWTSNEIVSYTVYYKLKDTNIDVADPREGADLAGWGVTVTPKTGDDLKPEYRNNCTPLSTNSYYLSLSTDVSKNTYTFYYKLNLADLTITKEIDGDDGEQYGKRDFIFNVSNGKDINMNVVVSVPEKATEGSVMIKGLPIGTYTITEDTGWSWRYELNGVTVNGSQSDVSNNSVNYTLENGTGNNIVFTNQLKNTKWLSFVNSMKNFFGMKANA